MWLVQKVKRSEPYVLSILLEESERVPLALAELAQGGVGAIA